MDNFDKQYAAARKAAKEAIHIEDATLCASSRTINLVLSNRVEVKVPVDIIEGLSGKSLQEVGKFSAAEEYLFWDELDVDLYLPGLLQQVFGTQHWMKELGRKGGSSKSKLKAEAARKNGAKGGRPRKRPANA